MYAISTAGSLAGTFASALALIPLVGRGAPSSVVRAALRRGRRRRRRGGASRWPCRPRSPAAALPVGTIKGSEDAKVLEEVETPSSVRARGRGAGRRAQARAQRGQAVHSLYRPGSYSRMTTGTISSCCPSRRASVRRAGCDPRQRGGHDGPRDGPLLPRHERGRGRDRQRAHPARPSLVRPANPRMTVHHEDARPFLRRTEGATTRSSWTSTASRTSPSTSPRASSSRSPATGSAPADRWS